MASLLYCTSSICISSVWWYVYHTSGCIMLIRGLRATHTHQLTLWAELWSRFSVPCHLAKDHTADAALPHATCAGRGCLHALFQQTQARREGGAGTTHRSTPPSPPPVTSSTRHLPTAEHWHSRCSGRAHVPNIKPGSHCSPCRLRPLRDWRGGPGGRRSPRWSRLCSGVERRCSASWVPRAPSSSSSHAPRAHPWPP